MIRVKTINIKQTGLKLVLNICVIIFILFIVRFICKLIRIESRAYASNLNLNIIENELGIQIDRIESKRVIKDEEVLILDNAVQEENIEKVQNQYIGSSSIKMWNRPSKYEVTTSSSGRVQVGNTWISNYSGLKLDTEELSNVSSFDIKKNANVLILHTHTSEGYSESGKDNNFRTLDDSMNVVSVGNVLKENLIMHDFNVNHCITKHDTPSYNSAYSNALKSLQAEFEKCNYDIVLDIHRDALSGNLNYRPTVEISGEHAAKLMFVVGTNGSGLKHDEWMENLKLALLIQNTANEMYPGLFRDLNLSKYRYNEDVCNGALILEVGATGNTLDEVWNAMKYFSNVLASLQE